MLVDIENTVVHNSTAQQQYLPIARESLCIAHIGGFPIWLRGLGAVLWDGRELSKHNMINQHILLKSSIKPKNLIKLFF